MQATCREMDGQLVAVPDNMRMDGNRPKGPPPEAMEACNGKSVGDSVVLTSPRGKSMKATCQEIDDQLVAVPDNMNMARPPLE